jgi:uncharacterized membrane protein (DUF4010 family)
MEPYEPLVAIATAIAVGLLVGMEREQAHPDDPSLFAGVRTYPIIAMIGAVATLLAGDAPWLPLVALAGVIVLVALSYAHALRSGQHGATTEASAIATYLLGALAASHGVVDPLSDRLLLVAALGVVLAFLLSSKQFLHHVASRVSREDFFATTQFLIVAVIALPLLPRHAIGPLGAIEPFAVGVMVVTISGLSFIGYVAMRLLGPGRGLLACAALGGLVSSTAVAVTMGRRTHEHAQFAPVAAAAMAVANTIMVARIAVLVAVVYAPLLATLALPLAAMALGSSVAARVVYRKIEAAGDTKIAVANPFELGSAFRFGVVFAAILLATKAATVYLGDRGLYLAGAVAGTTDVDAMTLSTARLSRGGIDTSVATIAILVAAWTNTIVKSAIAWVLGGRELGRRAVIVGALAIAGGALGLLAALAV